MFALKYLFKQLFGLLSKKEGRRLLSLMWKYGNIPRYQQEQIKFQHYELQVPDCLSFIFQYKEIFVDEFYKFNCEHKSPIIIDCGANIGMSLLYFKSLYPNAKIVAFEADSKISEILVGNLKNNNLSDIEVTNKAVWIDDKGIEFATEGSDGASIYGSGQKQFVESIRLSEFLAHYDQIDMLKIDIEGAENEVIDDCESSLSNVKNIFIEYHSYPNSAQKLSNILRILEKNKFRYFINSAVDRSAPFVNRKYKNNDLMDLQLNIFGYKN